MTPSRELAGGGIIAEHLDRAACATDQSQHQLHQRGLAGAVVTDQRDHLALGKVKGNIGHGRDATIMFRDAGQFAGRRHLGYLPENVSFDAALTGRETQAFYARLKREPVAKALELLDMVGLGPAAARRVGTYSKGMRQRLGLAQALIGRPWVLLLDEPTTGLDPELRQTFYEVIQRLAAEGTSVLLSSHALTELEERAGRVIIMNHGIKVADGSIEELRRLARLPTKIRLKVSGLESDEMPAWLPSGAPCRRLNGHIVEIDAAPEQKIDLLHRVTAEGSSVEDLDVVPPSLDELYAHFLKSTEMPR